MMVLSSASLCCLLLLEVVCSLTTASPAPYGEPVLNAIDQAEVAAPLYESHLTQATIQQNCCGCPSCPKFEHILTPLCEYCFMCPRCHFW